jgi:3-dehydroquinate synthase/shikimate kinase/3-dehydroquinate synthase
VARLVLVGLPGVGKSTLAHALAAELECAYLDTDDIVSESVGCSAAQYLRRQGVAAFRVAELAALEAALESDSVVATGAGVVTTPRARELLELEVTVWLDCDNEAILARLGGADRPLMGDEPSSSLSRLRGERDAWYEEVSRARVDAAGTLEDVTARILDSVGRA